MSDLSIHPVYLSARAAIVAPERAIPVTLYATQKWLPRLGPERWCLIMLLRSLSLESQRRGDGTKRISCSWRHLAEMLDVHEETVASWLKHQPIPNDKPWRRIIPNDEKAETLGLFIPRLRYAYETRNGKTRRIGFLLEILMEDPVVPEDEAQLLKQIEIMQLQQGELGLETHRLIDSVNAANTELPQISGNLHKPAFTDLHYVNPISPSLHNEAKSNRSDLHNSSVNPDNPDLLTPVKQYNFGSDSYVNQPNGDLAPGKSEHYGKNVNELDFLIQQLKQKKIKKNLRRDAFEPIIEITEALLDDDHSKGMLYKVLNVLYPERIDLYVSALRVALDTAGKDTTVNKGAVFVRALQDFADVAGVNLGFKRIDASQNENGQTKEDTLGSLGSLPRNFPPSSAPLQVPSAGEAIWAETQLVLRRQMTQATYDAIIQRTKLLGRQDNVYVIGVHSEMAKEWLENRLHDIVSRALASVVGAKVQIKFKLLDELS